MKFVFPGFAAASLGMLLTASCFADAPATNPAATPTPRAVIEKVIQEALAVLRDPNLTKPERSAKVRAIAYGAMDFETLARLSLGSSWRSLTDAQHAEFTAEFKKHVAATYGHTTDQYTDEDIIVGDDNAEPRGDWTVRTRIMGTENGVRKEVAKVDYRLRKKDDRWLIIDVTIDNVSLMANFRAQFQDIMTNGGYNQLIKMLKDKNAAAEK